jgi:hypothetical protein
MTLFAEPRLRFPFKYASRLRSALGFHFEANGHKFKVILSRSAEGIETVEVQSDLGLMLYIV